MPVNGSLDLGDHEHQVATVSFREIPMVAPQFVANMVNKSLRSVKMDGLVASDQGAQQPVKAKEVVDMRMGDKNVFKPQQLPRRERLDAPEIDQQRPLFEQHFD